jgi:hypothetical protein
MHLPQFENTVLRRIFERKWDEMMEVAENYIMRSFNTLYASPNIIRIIKSKRICWAGRVANMGRRGMHIGFWWESQKAKYH